MNKLKKYKLAILPFFAGLALLFYSWYASFPVWIKFPGDYVFNHVSPFYWVSLPLILGSLYIIGVFSKNRPVKFFAVIATVLAIYSLFYFSSTMPTQDSQFFRGLAEYFINSHKLDSSQINHFYLQWPSYFFLADIVTSVTGLSLIQFEFLFFAIIGVLMSTALYVYASKLFKDAAVLAVISFFVSMYYFLNYQSVPFSFAIALTFILFMLETQKKSTPVIVSMFVIFFCISITHFFVAIFFILYLVIRTIISKSKQYAALSLLTFAIYVVSQLTFDSWTWLQSNFKLFLNSSPEYSGLVQASLKTSIIPADVLFQNISRTVTVGTILICLLGFILLLATRKLRAIDAAIFISGLAYAAIGLVAYFLGTRSIPIFFIPIALGTACLLETVRLRRFRPILHALFLVLILLFVFAPIHNSFNTFASTYVPIQTSESSNAEHFLLDNYNWMIRGSVLSHYPITLYLESRLEIIHVRVTLDDDSSLTSKTLKDYNCVFYTVGLGNSFEKYNYTIDGFNSQEKLSVIYNNGISQISVRTPVLISTP